MKNHASCTIRAYGHADTEELLSIWMAASRIGHPFLSEADLLEQRQLVRDVYFPKAETWVAEGQGKLLGFIGLLDSFIGGLFVHPQAHGGGVARALVDHAARLKLYLELEVYAANPVAPGFYRHIGFHEIGRRAKDDEGHPFELIRMRRG